MLTAGEKNEFLTSADVRIMKDKSRDKNEKLIDIQYQYKCLTNIIIGPQFKLKIEI